MPKTPSSRIHLVFGRDDYRIAETVRELADAPDAAMGDLNRTVLEGEKLSPGELQGHLQAVPFMADSRTVIVRGLAARFETASRAAKRPPEVTGFLEAVASASPATTAIFAEGDIRAARNPLAIGLKEAGAVLHECRYLNEQQLANWVREYASAHGMQISQRAVQDLIAAVGANLWVMSLELDKLGLYADGRMVQPSDVQQLVTADREQNIFALVDDIAAGRGQRVMLQLGEMLDEGQSVFTILAHIQNKIRQLWLLHGMAADNVPTGLMQNRAGLAGRPEFVVRQALDVARRIPESRFREMHRLLLEADELVKTGKREPRLALELLTLDLAFRKERE